MKKSRLLELADEITDCLEEKKTLYGDLFSDPFYKRLEATLKKHSWKYRVRPYKANSECPWDYAMGIFSYFLCLEHNGVIMTPIIEDLEGLLDVVEVDLQS